MDRCASHTRHRRRFAMALLLAAGWPSVGIAQSASRSTPAAAAPVPSGASGRAPVDVDLRPRFQAGRTTRYTFEIDSQNKYVSPSDPELDQEQTQRERITLRMAVKRSGPEGSTLEIEFERVELALKTPDVDVNVDSAKPPATNRGGASKGSTGQTSSGTPAAGSSSPPSTDPLAQFADVSLEDIVRTHVQAVAKTVLTISLDSAGNIVSITGGEALGGGISGLGGLGGLAGAGARGIGTPPQAVARWTVSGLGQPGTVRVGQTWTTTSDVSGTPIGGLSMTTRSTLESASGGVARIAFRGSADGTPSAGGAGGHGGGTGVQLQRASYDGDAEWDIERGEIRALRATTKVALGSNAAGVRATMTSTQRVRLTRAR